MELYALKLGLILVLGFFFLWYFFGGKQIQEKAPPPKDSKVESLPEVKKKKQRKGERLLCEALTEIYGVPFVTVRPDFMVNPETGRRIEFDCYNDDLKIAGEYNGPQHYVWPNYLERKQTYDQFIKQVRRDQLKVELSDKNGVYLITVPYNVPYNMIKDYVRYYTPESQQQRLEQQRQIVVSEYNL
jgi:hypothetical protein